ncbi:hypothetical protein [Brachybacterium sp. NPDC056505]|uniref:hypothetical protein n=1 Tax=Brachybacterium sp. NPDC056505 TaxID=3345843 RepID=UPI003671ED10
MRTYATKDDLPEGLEPQGDVGAQLVYASALVEGYTRTALYVTDGDGYPQDPAIADAFKVAVVTQVAAWAALGIDPSAGVAGTSTGGVVASKSIGSASLSYQASARAADDKAAAVSTLTPTAASLLDAAVRDRRVWVIG